MNLRPLLAVAALWLAGCAGESPDQPPTVFLGESVCAHCNMIISDERFASATVVRGPRGPEAYLFDDFNCQMDYERSHPDAEIVSRWAHDYETGTWFHPDEGWFVRSDELVTPMGSQMALFRSEEAARNLAQKMGGEVLAFQDAWKNP